MVVALLQFNSAKVPHLALAGEKAIIGLDALDLFLEFSGDSGIGNSPEHFRDLVAFFLEDFDGAGVRFKDSLGTARAFSPESGRGQRNTYRMHKSKIGLSISNLVGELFGGIRSVRQRRDHTNGLTSEKDDGEIDTVRRVDEHTRLFLQSGLVAQSDTELKSSRTEVGQGDGPPGEGIDECRVVGKARLGGEVVPKDGVGRSKLHGRVGRVVNGHVCASFGSGMRNARRADRETSKPHLPSINGPHQDGAAYSSMPRPNTDRG